MEDRLPRRGRISASQSRLSRDAPPLRGCGLECVPRLRRAGGGRGIIANDRFPPIRDVHGNRRRTQEELLMDAPTYEVLALRYATQNRSARENFIATDTHDALMPLDYFIWVIRG